MKLTNLELVDLVNSMGVGNPQWVGTHTHGGCGCGLEFLNPQATHTHIVGYPHPPYSGFYLA